MNTFVDPLTLKEDYVPPKIEMARATPEEKKQQLENVMKFQKTNAKEAEEQIANLKAAALKGENLFAASMEASRYCSLFQITEALYEAGGRYRRNL